MRALSFGLRSVLSVALGIAGGTLLAWLLLATGYHLGTVLTLQSKKHIEKGPIEILGELRWQEKNLMEYECVHDFNEKGLLVYE